MHQVMPRTPGRPAPRPSRRFVLTAAGSVALGAVAAGCGPRDSGLSAPASTAEASTIPRDGALSAPEPSAAPGAAVPASRSEIERRFAGRPPGRWGLDLPGITTHTGTHAVALTFDACGGPGGSGYDSRLIDLLRRLRVPATLFLNARWTSANPSLSRELASDPLFEIGNHGLAHLPLSTTGRSAYGIAGTRSVDAVIDEVSGGASAIIALTGKRPPWFRPGTAFYDETAVQVVAAMALCPLSFSVNSDGGATFPPRTVAAQLGTVRPGDIVIGHLNQPRSGTSAGYAAALPALIDQGLDFTTLSQARAPIPSRPEFD